MDGINADPKYDDEVAGKLKSAIESFKANNTW